MQPLDPSTSRTVSVIIPTYNHQEFVGQATASALGQSLKPIEVIVVDDGSTDHTAKKLATFGDSISIVFQPNSGVSSARNRGAAMAKGELLAFLDADDYWEREKLLRQVATLAQYSRAAMVHCGVRFVDQSRVEIGQEIRGLMGNVARDLLLMRRPVILGGGSGILVNRCAFEEIGGFDESLSTSADWDFFYRFSRRHEVAFVPDILLNYRVHSGNMHKNVTVMKHDMNQAMAAAFQDDYWSRSTRRSAMSRLDFILAGCFAEGGDWQNAFLHGLRSVIRSPEVALSSFLQRQRMHRVHHIEKQPK